MLIYSCSHHTLTVDHPIVASVIEFCFLGSSEVIRESLQPQRSLGHCHGVGDDTTDTARSALVVHNLRSLVRLPSMHRDLIRCFLRLLELHVCGDIIGLAAQELLLVFFGVDHRGVQAAHLTLSKDQLAQVLRVLFSLFGELGPLRGFGPINFLSLQDHFVEPGNSIGLSSSENAVLVRNGRRRVFDDSMDLSGHKEDPFDELVLGVQGKPVVDELLWQGLNIL